MSREIQALRAHVAEDPVDDPGLDNYPAVAGLEKWERQALRSFKAEQTKAKQPLDFEQVASFFRGALPPDASDLERSVIAGLALSMWGAEHIDAARVRLRRRSVDAPPFSSFVEVLHAALYGADAMGTGSPMPSSVDPSIPQVEVQRPNPARIGYDYMPAKQSRSGSTGGCRALGAVNRHLDAKRAVSRSLVSPTSLWMVSLLYLGQVEKWDKDKGGKLGKLAKKNRTEIAALYRKRVCVCGVGGAAEGHAEQCEASSATDRAVSEKITRARERLVTSLVNDGLIPEPRTRVEGPKKKPRRPRFDPFARAFEETSA